VSPVLGSLPLQRDFAPSRPSGLALQLKGLFQATLQRLKISNVTGENSNMEVVALLIIINHKIKNNKKKYNNQNRILILIMSLIRIAFPFLPFL
jgi:hypothetical protein